MEKREKIEEIDQIKSLVDAFYGKVKADPLLAPIFENRIKGDWDKHLDKMYRFWQTILLEEHTYYGSPFTPHASMPIDAQHFERWLELFKATVNEKFTGEKAKEAIWRAEKMALMFQAKLNYYRENEIYPLK
ncbi:group III truncated hemoglobin [Cyclobacterium sp. SYSU L10401]|uniref:group III truncated hemoglobin n=1 Tax=Cyclobacterium sp. SYSU L10401 TaxID=2678657 RepID=UPI0013D69297|nr:group III truncated hemoglobin [Cyclobacterium sp. SYSU L10401]